MSPEAGKPGRQRYTDEPTVAAAATFLAEAEQKWREDAARNRITLGAVQVELSRLYLDETNRRLILRRIQRRLGQNAANDEGT